MNMDATAFWQVIGQYNSITIWMQVLLLIALISGVVLTYTQKRGWVCKMALSVVNLFIGIGFFAVYGTQPIQHYFALPLYLAIGLLFAWDAWKNRDEQMMKPTFVQWCFFLLFLFYPFVSMACGHTFPQLVTHIMPCPVVTISIALYACYRKRNTLLLALLTIWGLTGVKAIIFSAYEDLILLAAGVYGVVLIIGNLRKAL